MSSSYVSLEPGFTQQISQSAGLTSGITDLATSATFLYGASIMIVVVTAGLMYAHAGALRIGASTNSISKSNAEIRRVTIGLLGVLSLFLIISAVNKDLLTGNVDLNQFGTGSVVSTGNVGTTGGVGGQTNGNTNQTPSTVTGTGSENLQILNAVGITINHNNIPCTQAQMGETNPSCTSLEGLQKNTVNMLLQLKSSCPNCSIVITGGTEPGHSSTGNHRIGGNAVDISLNNALSNFLQTQGTSLGIGTAKWLWGGYTFWNEPAGATANTTAAHYHVDQ